VLLQENAGHGRACEKGYERALRTKAPWILQIDSDGQCDPKYFPLFWEARKQAQAVLGLRARREDGRLRCFATWLVKAMIACRMRKWIADPNVPYRLMCRELLLSFFLLSDEARVPFINIALSLHLSKEARLSFVPITFRKRFLPRRQTSSFYLGGAWHLWRQTATLNHSLRHGT
jgi:dolichol-phosphate mannosyltransferase